MTAKENEHIEESKTENTSTQQTDEKHGTKTHHYNDSNQKQNRKQRKQNINITETKNEHDIIKF